MNKPITFSNSAFLFIFYLALGLMSFAIGYLVRGGDYGTAVFPAVLIVALYIVKPTS